jgi:hypothetical protein
LGAGVFLQIIHVVNAAFRLVLLALDAALGFVPLFLLAGLFFLTLGKCRSASWHTQSPNLDSFSSRSGELRLRTNPNPIRKKPQPEENPAGNLPARFAGLTGVSLVVIASASTTTAAAAKPLSAALGPVSLWLRLVDGQGAAPQLCSVQCRNSLLGLSGIGHFHKPEAARPPSFPVSD